jgi:hypothetical protein
MCHRLSGGGAFSQGVEFQLFTVNSEGWPRGRHAL